MHYGNTDFYSYTRSKFRNLPFFACYILLTLFPLVQSEKLVTQRAMNVMDDNSCHTCQTSHGFSAAERQSIIIMVLLTAFALVSCYVGVLWFAIRTRSSPNKDAELTDQNVRTNKAFNDEQQDNENLEPMIGIRGATTITQYDRFIGEKV